MGDIIKFKEESGQGPDFYYSNVFELVLSIYDFTFVWGFKTPEQAKAQATAKDAKFTALANVSMSPSQAKAAVVILKEMIGKYEAEFGEIPLDKDFKDRYRKVFGEKPK